MDSNRPVSPPPSAMPSRVFGFFRGSWRGSRLRLPEEAREQLDGLIETYDRLKARAGKDFPGSDGEIALLKTKIANVQATLWWTDVAQAELCVVDVLGDADLLVHLQGWRRRAHDVLGEARYSVYLSTAPNLSGEVKPEVLRADLGECVRAVYYFYSAYGVSARSRSGVTIAAMRVAIWILLSEGLVAAILAAKAPSWMAWWPTVPDRDLGALEFMLATSATAVLGSIVSVQRRVQDPTVDTDPFYRYIQTTADYVGIAVVPPVFGAIFGMVMYGLLVSKLIMGTLLNLNDNGVPTGADHIGLLLVLGFVAGFAEQLIPDALNRIAARALSSVSTTTIGPVTPPSVPPPKNSPTVTGLSVQGGSAGTPVAIVGSGFSATGLVVKFGDTPAPNPIIDSDTQLRVNSPHGTGTVDIVVTTDMGTSQATAASKYVYA
jgi:hypothetical protein